MLVGQAEYISLLWDAINVDESEGEKVLGVFTIFESTTDYSVETEWDVKNITPGCMLEVVSWPTLPICVIAACCKSALPENLVKMLKEVRVRHVLWSPCTVPIYRPVVLSSSNVEPQHVNKKACGGLEKRARKPAVSSAFMCSQ
jgi:hypothetical protein